MLNPYDDKHFVSGMIVAYHTPDRSYNRHRNTRSYMRSRYSNPLAWDFVKETSTMYMAKVTIKSNKVTFSCCYGAKNPPQCASAKFW